MEFIEFHWIQGVYGFWTDQRWAFFVIADLGRIHTHPESNGIHWIPLDSGCVWILDRSAMAKSITGITGLKVVIGCLRIEIELAQGAPLKARVCAAPGPLVTRTDIGSALICPESIHTLNPMECNEFHWIQGVYGFWTDQRWAFLSSLICPESSPQKWPKWLDFEFSRSEKTHRFAERTQAWRKRDPPHFRVPGFLFLPR